jgi:hypothetical protein
MDVIYNSFSNLFGKSTSNKNDVIQVRFFPFPHLQVPSSITDSSPSPQNVSWQFTGGKSAQYSYRGAGN